MCGRYSLSTPADELAAHFELMDVPSIEPRYNIAPTQEVPVVWRGRRSERRRLSLARWGLVPPGSPDLSVGAKMINARSETVAEKPSFRSAFRQSRCLVPADGFYEWGVINGRKQPYHVAFPGLRLFAFAGLWEVWAAPDGTKIATCTVLTTDANPLLAPIHDRMPVILSPTDYNTRWLRHATPANDLQALLQPSRHPDLTVTPVDTVVNSVANDGPECLNPPAPSEELDLFS